MAASTPATAAKAKKAKRRSGAEPHVPSAALSAPATPPGQTVAMIPIESIAPSFLNRRIDEFDPRFLDLAASIDSLGLQSPIAVRPLGAEYELIYGERRWRACRNLGHACIAATVHDVDEPSAHIMRMAENRLHQSLSDMEESDAVATLLSLYNHDVSEAAAKIGMSESWVRRRATLCALSDRWREELADPETDYAHIRDSVTQKEEIAMLPEAEQNALLDDGGVRWTRTTAELRQAIRKFLRRLDARPWPDDFEATLELGKSPLCEYCKNRSDALGDLFAGTGQADEGNNANVYCLDSRCWMRKTGMWLKTVVAEAKTRARREGLNPTVQLLLDRRLPAATMTALRDGASGVEFLPEDAWYDFAEAKDIKDSVRDGFGPMCLAVIASGPRIGEIVEGCFGLADDAPDENDGEGGTRIDYDEMQRRASERRRINGAFFDALVKHIPKTTKRDDALLLRLVRWYGYSSRDHYQDGLAVMPPEKPNPHSALWKHVLDKMRWRFQERDRSDEDKDELCRLLGIESTDAVAAEAEAALAAETAKEGE